MAEQRIGERRGNVYVSVAHYFEKEEHDLEQANLVYTKGFEKLQGLALKRVTTCTETFGRSST